MLSVLPAGLAVAVLCALVITEIVFVPGVVLPGGTVTLLAGALAGAGRAPLEIAAPVAAAVIIGDHLAYRAGPEVVLMWRWDRPGRTRRRAAEGGAPRWLLAAVPPLAGAARVPYSRFAVNLLAVRLPWLAGMLAAGAVAPGAAAGIGRGGGLAAAAVAAVAFLAVPAVAGRLPVRVIARRPRLRPYGLLLAAASLAAGACGSLVQDAAAGEQTARLDPRVAGLLASHVHPDAASKAAAIAGAGLVLAMAVAGQSFTSLAAGASLGVAVAGGVEAAARLRCGRWLAD